MEETLKYGKLAHGLSWVLHPFLQPVYLMGVLLTMTTFALYPANVKFYLLWVVALYAILIPVLSLGVLHSLGRLSSYRVDDRRERRSRRGGTRLRRNLNISSPAISFAFTESIHRIAEKFQHEHAKGRRVFLFSSVSAAEGKSTLAANTAISLASRGVNVLFIDLDLRRPVQSEMLGLSVKQKNELGTLLTESAAPEKILAAAVTDPATGLHSLLSTKSYTDVIELLASDQLAKVVALARERYDYVIIDSPPLGFFSDSELLSDLSDASVLVVRQDTVPAPEINDAIDALRAGKAEFLGCILNDMAHLAAWSSGYGYGYGKKYDKYGYGQHSARKTQ